MSNVAHVVPMVVHPKFTRHYISLDMEGYRLLVGDLFIDSVGNNFLLEEGAAEHHV